MKTEPTKSANQSYPLPEGNWSDALVLIALGRAIAESHASVVGESMPAELEQLLAKLTKDGGSDERH